MAKVTIEIPDGIIPEGYEAVAFRNPDLDTIVDASGYIYHEICATAPRLILRKKQPAYRKPTVHDIGKQIEVSDNAADHDWRRAKLTAILRKHYAIQGRFIAVVPGDDQLSRPWIHARIRDT